MPEATDKATRPTEVFVCGKRFDIRYGGSWIDESFTYGSVDFCKGIIDLKRDLSDDHCREFLWHELVHCADKQLDLNLPAATKRTQDESGLRLYEPEVLAFSTAQWMTLSDPRNAGVISWMLGFAHDDAARRLAAAEAELERREELLDRLDPVAWNICEAAGIPRDPMAGCWEGIYLLAGDAGVAVVAGLARGRAAEAELAAWDVLKAGEKGTMA